MIFFWKLLVKTASKRYANDIEKKKKQHPAHLTWNSLEMLKSIEKQREDRHSWTWNSNFFQFFWKLFAQLVNTTTRKLNALLRAKTHTNSLHHLISMFKSLKHKTYTLKLNKRNKPDMWPSEIRISRFFFRELNGLGRREWCFRWPWAPYHRVLLR